MKIADRFNVVVGQWLDDRVDGELTDEFAGFTLNYASCSSMPDRYEVWSDGELVAHTDSKRDFRRVGSFIFQGEQNV